MVRELPLNPLWESLGATLKTESDWRIPSMFKDFQSEYQAVRKSVGLIDLSYRGKIEVTGKDRISFLHRMLAGDIQGLGIGTGCYTALLSAAGKVLMDTNLLVFANSVYLGTEIGNEKRVINLLNGFIINEDLKLKDVTEDFALIALQGPRSEALAQAIFPGHFPELTKRQHVNFHIGEADVTLIRISRTGEWGYHLQIPKDMARDAVDRVMVVGKLYGMRPVGFGATEILRIESGVPRYGVDITEDITLPETGLEKFAASETKGCYPGQEVVARSAAYGGPAKKLTGLIFAKGILPAAGDKIYSGGEEIGWVTSAAISPALDKGIALGYVKKGFFEKSSAVTIKTKQGPLESTTTTLPFIPLSSSQPSVPKGSASCL